MVKAIYQIAAIAMVIMLSGSIVQADNYYAQSYPAPQQQQVAPAPVEPQGDLGIKIIGPPIVNKLSSARLKRNLGATQLVGQTAPAPVNHLLGQTLPQQASPAGAGVQTGSSGFMRRNRVQTNEK